MEVFNKLYSQVSNSVSVTVSQLSGVLPGNPVTREFDASSHVASAGPGLLWKVYKGRKRSTKQEASIFVFEKRQLERWNKADRDTILEILKRGVLQLTKIRHPRILTVQHQLEESRESLAFATEPVFASLANILGQTHNMPQPANLSDYKLFDIEIKYGLLQIGEGLAFLHNDVKLMHRNITPETILINQNGAWKIFGFDFCVHNTSPANSTPFFPFEQYCPTLPAVAQPSLEYLAPECVLAQTYSTSSDMFSLGVLAYTLHSVGNQSLLNVKDLQQFKTKIKELNHLPSGKLKCLPDSLKENVRRMLNLIPESRPDAHNFIKGQFFDDVGVKTLTDLDSLLQWDNVQKSKFYKGLPEALAKLPQRIMLQQVLPCLSRDVTQPTMVPFVLPSIFKISQQCKEKEFVELILPVLKPLMKLTEPVQILLIFLQQMELLLKLTPDTDIQQHVLPMLYRGLDSDTPQIHEMCLSILPTFANLLDHASVKNSVLPRIKRLCLSTSTLSVRVNCLLSIGKLLEHLDKWLVLDEILPFLPQIPSREPAVLMGILGIYKLAMTHKKLGITKEIVATRVLPFLIPLCIENGLSLSQFNALVALVKELFQLVETEHRTKLEQLNNVQEETRTLTSTMPTITPESKQELNQAFMGLGLDNFISKPKRDAAAVYQNQQTLAPKPAENAKPKVAAKDLTSNLSQIDSQLWANANMMNSPNANTMISSHKSTGFPVQSPTNSIMPSLPVAPVINMNQYQMQWGGNTTNQNLWNNQSLPQHNWGGLSTQTNQSWNIPVARQQNVQSPNANSTPLSKDDIMDLLS